MRNAYCYSERDYEKYFVSSVGSKVTESSSISTGSWAYNTTYKAAHINSGSTNKSSVILDVNFLKAGDAITVSAEIMNISGVKGKLAIDRAENSSFTGGATNIDILQTDKADVFEQIEITYIVEKDGYFQGVVGLFTGDVGECYIRNISVECKTQTNDKSPVQRVQTFALESDGAGSFSKLGVYGTDAVTINMNSGYIQVLLDKPYEHLAYKPVVSVQGWANAKDYDIRVFNIERNSMFIQFFDSATGDLIADHTQIPSGVTFNVTLVGYDFV